MYSWTNPSHKTRASTAPGTLVCVRHIRLFVGLVRAFSPHNKNNIASFFHNSPYAPPPLSTPLSRPNTTTTLCSIALNFPGKCHCPHSPPTDQRTDRTYTATQHIDCCEQITTHSVDLPTYLNKKYTPLPILSLPRWSSPHPLGQQSSSNYHSTCNNEVSSWEGEQQTIAYSANKSFLYGLIHTNHPPTTPETVNF